MSYCKEHQSNTPVCDSANCLVCQLIAQINEVKKMHNGYDPEMRKASETLKEPSSLKAAVRELIDEERKIAEYETNALHTKIEQFKAAIWSDDSTETEKGLQTPEDAARFVSDLRMEMASLYKILRDEDFEQAFLGLLKTGETIAKDIIKKVLQETIAEAKQEEEEKISFEANDEGKVH